MDKAYKIVGTFCLSNGNAYVDNPFDALIFSENDAINCLNMLFDAYGIEKYDKHRIDKGIIILMKENKSIRCVYIIHEIQYIGDNAKYRGMDIEFSEDGLYIIKCDGETIMRKRSIYIATEYIDKLLLAKSVG